MRRVGRYEILSELGRGGSGVVYAGRDLIDGCEVAIKEVRESSAACRGTVEGEVLGRLRHPGVLRVLDTFRQAGRSFIVMERVDGESLEALLARKGTLDVEQAVALTCQAARALAAIHRQGVIHRDIKPANLLLTADGGLKIADFGVALCSRDDGEGGEFLGTPAYVAPERWRGVPADPRSDLYALGVVFFRMLTGQRPHQGSTVQELARNTLFRPAPPPSRLRPGLPAGLDRICARLLARDPAERFAGGEEVAHALEEVVLENLECGRGGQPAAAAGPLEQTWQRLPRPGRRSGGRAWWLAAALAAGVLLLVAPGRRPPRGDGVRVAAPPAAVSRSPVPALPNRPQGAGERGGVREERAWRPARMPPRAVLERYAARDGRKSAPSEEARAAAAGPRPVPRVAAPDKPAPEPAAARWERPPESLPPSGDGADPLLLRGVVEVSHALGEGLVELRIDGRRRALVRIGVGETFGPAEPVLIPYEVAAGRHHFELRLLSASAGVEVERVWDTSSREGGFHPRRLRLVAGDGGWKLVAP
ncbi:MAG: protein kinase [Acidobacteriota bacterium]|nr:protein kinase [Acidobacteriota bacterium]MDQ7088279.1 protein kinase [Acidobacteriota bacterium]